MGIRSLEKFLENEPTSISSQIPGTLKPRHIHQTIIGTYIQDDFRFRPYLTLNLGLRYEMSTVPYETSGEVSNLRKLDQPTPTLGNPYWQNPTYKTSSHGSALLGTHSTTANRRSAAVSVSSISCLCTTRSPPRVHRLNPSSKWEPAALTATPGRTVPDTRLCPVTGVTSTFRGTQFQDNPKRNYVKEWNLDLQHQLTPSLSVSAGYVGTRGVHMVTKTTEDDIVEPTLTSAGWLWPDRSAKPQFPAKVVNGDCIPSEWQPEDQYKFRRHQGHLLVRKIRLQRNGNPNSKAHVSRFLHTGCFYLGQEP